MQTPDNPHSNYLAFDIEISSIIPDGENDWKKFRPLGISCAATMAAGSPPVLWNSPTEHENYADRMTQDALHQLVTYLTEAVQQGWQILTWNGLGFDFDILAEESGLLQECRLLALNHIDMMFHIFCLKGFPLGLDKAAKGMGLSGKTAGMSGDLAPVLWQQGEHKKVLQYVAQDVRTTLEVGLAVANKRRLSWISNSGRPQSLSFDQGWLTAREAMNLPLPDTSWMRDPWPREKFTNWLVSTQK
jgi:hypothetical protein